MSVESYGENNLTASIAASTVAGDRRGTNHYWLGLASLDDLKTNTLESASGTLASQYSGMWAPLALALIGNATHYDTTIQLELLSPVALMRLFGEPLV